jgi:hypothetical protein
VYGVWIAASYFLKSKGIAINESNNKPFAHIGTSLVCRPFLDWHGAASSEQKEPAG